MRHWQDEESDSHFPSLSLDSIPNRPLSRWQAAVATFSYYCFNEMSVPQVRVCVCVFVCLRKRDVSEPRGPVYLHTCVGAEAGRGRAARIRLHSHGCCLPGTLVTVG